MFRSKRCRPTAASTSTSAWPAKRCCARSRGTAACSARTARYRVRRFSCRTSAVEPERISKLLRALCFLRSGSAQDVRERIVTLVTGIFEHAVVRQSELVLAGPRLGIESRVGHREHVVQLVVIDARELLDNDRFGRDEVHVD